MNYSSEDQDKTLLTPPSSRQVVGRKTTETLKIPSHFNMAEIRQFLGSAFFNEHAVLLLQVGSASQSIVFSPVSQTILGRVDQDESQAQCLNLSGFDAREHGMSRKHAALHRNELTLSIQDLGSKNGTYVNGYRLTEGEFQILRDRDELLLGNLPIRVAFQYGATE